MRRALRAESELTNQNGYNGDYTSPPQRHIHAIANVLPRGRGVGPGRAGQARQVHRTGRDDTGSMRLRGRGRAPVGRRAHADYSDDAVRPGRCGLDQVPIVAGVGAPSTRETVYLAKRAQEAGADHVMVIPPGYYAGALQSNGGEALRRFFVDVAAGSPLPVIVYNFPGVSAGIDLDSDLILDVLREAPNVVGVKLTCASVGKITRINAVTSSEEFKSQYPRISPHAEFRIIDGYIDILLPSISSGAAGAISGLPNLVPRTCVRLWELANYPSNTPEYKEAQRLQNELALVDGFMQKIGFAGMKMLLHKQFGYGRLPRRPLLPSSEESAASWFKNPLLLNILKEEEKYAVAS
ncbi:hypothetical protein G7054_g7763 [Neopestalotiopsis clavispora]|nr:hypothetical protein G7054_g7763 [Neopestalotiopsis clavispora]